MERRNFIKTALCGVGALVAGMVGVKAGEKKPEYVIGVDKAIEGAGGSVEYAAVKKLGVDAKPEYASLNGGPLKKITSYPKKDCYYISRDGIEEVEIPESSWRNWAKPMPKMSTEELVARMREVQKKLKFKAPITPDAYFKGVDRKYWAEVKKHGKPDAIFRGCPIYWDNPEELDNSYYLLPLKKD